MDLDFYTVLKILVAQLMMPMPLCLGLFFLGLMLGWKRTVGRFCISLAVIFLTLLSWAPVADRLLVGFESAHPPLYDWPVDARPEAVMVLGAGYQPNQPWPVTGQLSDSAVNRLAEGLRLWNQAPDTLLIVSGTDRRPEVPSMALGYESLARQLGVPEGSIHALTAPRDTGEEARAAADLLGEEAVLVLVTSASHMNRAMNHFKAAGLKPIPAPTHYLALRDDLDTLSYWVPSARHLRKSERAFYEALGSLASRWE